jgi:hypothetical protein
MEFLCGCKISSWSSAGAWKLVTEGEIYVVLRLFMLVGIIQKPTTKRVLSRLVFGDIVTETDWN